MQKHTEWGYLYSRCFVPGALYYPKTNFLFFLQWWKSCLQKYSVGRSKTYSSPYQKPSNLRVVPWCNGQVYRFITQGLWVRILHVSQWKCQWWARQRVYQFVPMHKLTMFTIRRIRWGSLCWPSSSQCMSTELYLTGLWCKPCGIWWQAWCSASANKQKKAESSARRQILTVTDSAGLWLLSWILQSFNFDSA